MKRITLVSCVSVKHTQRCPARNLYISQWFVKAREYAERRDVPWFILSAKHGLLHPGEVIDPYEMTLRSFTQRQRQRWACRVFQQLDDWCPNPTAKDRGRLSDIQILAGVDYRERLVPMLDTLTEGISIPMHGLGIGEQLGWLTRKLRAMAMAEDGVTDADLQRNPEDVATMRGTDR